MTAIAKTPPESASMIAAAYGAATRDLAALAGPITSAAEADAATDRARAHKRTIGVLKASRDEQAKPLAKLLKDTRDRWNPTIKSYEAAIASEKKRISAFESLKLASAAMALTPSVAPSEIAAVTAMVAPRAKGSHQRVTYSARVTDPARVPREFLKVDQSALDAWAKQCGKDGKPFDIPGCELVAESRTVIT